MIFAPIWSTPAGILFPVTNLVALGDTITYQIISGSLPDGLSLMTDGTIIGSIAPVIVDITHTFVVRATNSAGVADRTFNIVVTSATYVEWITTTGYLPCGLYKKKYILNNQWVDFQLTAEIASDAPPNTTIQYKIDPSGDSLPPGLTLSHAGRISGKVRIESFATDDHRVPYNLTNITGGVPKLYTMYIDIGDAANPNLRQFKILVLSPNIFRSDTAMLPIINELLSLSVLPAYSSFLQQIQWINNSDLGIVQANNYQIINVAGYDPAPIIGPVAYSLVVGSTALTTLPEGLLLDSKAGIIYSFIPYQPAFTRKYQFIIAATKTSSGTGETITSSNTFTLIVKGQINSGIEWISPFDLGDITTGITSELAVLARQVYADSVIKFQIINGTLPYGLVLERDGTLSGKVHYDAVNTYTFTVRASDSSDLNFSDRTFTLRAVAMDNKKYTEMYFRPFFSIPTRTIYKDFMANEFTFDPEMIYRYYDPNFGIQHDIRMTLEFGIEQLNLADYADALRTHFYHKRLYFGDVKVAVARNSKNEIVYEIVYVDVVDDFINNQGISISSEVIINSKTFYPSSITNMRTQLHKLVLVNGESIGINEFNQPIYMQPKQADNYMPAGYMRVIPLCYALPGKGVNIVSRIKLSGFDFKLLSFEVDRLIVQTSTDNDAPKYLTFNNSDNIIR